MSLISFLKNVGKDLFGGKSDPKPEELKKELDSHDLGTQGVQVSVDGDKVVLKGEVKDRETLEKAVLAVGNVASVGSVDTDSVKVASDAPESVFYEVKSGDTLWKIAEAHYGKGNGSKYNIIFDANRPMLTSPDKIYPGQKLRIPPLS